MELCIMKSLPSQYKKYLVLSILLAASLAQTAHAKPARIHFAHGAFSKTIRGHLSKLQPDASYMVKVRAGQQMSIKVETVKPYTIETVVVPLLEITSPSGKRTSDKNTRFDTPKTEAGDYQIRVGVNLMATNGEEGDYKLKVWVR